jgi:hypothetical protein
MTHAHLLEMGGFVLCFSEEMNGEISVLDDGVVEQRVIETLSFKRFKELLEESSIEFPTITECEIKDRAKSDGLTKFIAAVKSLWFATQCFIRHWQNLAITQLELTTLALASLNWLALCYWRAKPQDLTIPIPVYILAGSPEWYRQKAACNQECTVENNQEEALELIVMERGAQKTVSEQQSAQWEERKAELAEQTAERSQWFSSESQWLKDRDEDHINKLKSLEKRNSWRLNMRRLWNILLGKLTFMVVGLGMAIGQIIGLCIGPVLILVAFVASVGFFVVTSNWIRFRRSGSSFQIRFRSCPRICIDFPRSFPDKDTQVVVEEEEGTQIVSRNTIFIWHIPLIFTIITTQSIYQVHPEVMTQFLHNGRLLVNQIRASIGDWFTWANFFRRRTLWLLVFFVSLGPSLFILMPLGMSTLLTMFFIRIPEICGFVDMHITTWVPRSGNQDSQLRFYSNVILKNQRLSNYFNHTSHFLIALTIGTSFGAIHCSGWNYSYPSMTDQLIWRVASLTLLFIPAVFFTVSWPL